MSFWKAVLDELSRWRRLLLHPSLIGPLLLALLGGICAYQVGQVHVVDVGGFHDAPYLDGFHAPEPDRRQVPEPEEDFRWTRGRVGIHLLGIGRQAVEVRLRLQAYRPPGVPPPQLALAVGAARVLTTTVGPEFQVYRLVLPADLLPGGDLHLDLYADTFRPTNDPRELGVALDRMEVRPAAAGWVGPAWNQIGSVLGVTLLAYCLLRRWGLGQRWTVGVATGISGLLSWLLAFHRLSLTYFTPTLVLLLAWGALLTALFLPLLEQRWPTGRPLLEVRLLWVILLLGLLLRLGGMLYPQFRSSDLIFHAHRAAWVASGDLIFTADLPDVNVPAPYPPGLYVSLLPAGLLLPDLPLLLQIAGVLLDALCGLLLYLLARGLTGRPRLALLALFLQQAAPVTYWIYSWGNYTNLFSRAALLGVMVLLCLGRWQRPGRRDWPLLAGAGALVFLGHFADSVLFLLFALVVVGLALLVPRGRRALPALLGALGVAGLLALGLYYTAPPVWEALMGGVDLLLQGEGRPPVLVNPVDQFLDHVQRAVALLALPGLALLSRRLRAWPKIVLGGALLTAVAFGLGQALFGFSTRYSLFVLPVLALGAAALLVPLWKRGWAGRLVVAALLAQVLWTTLHTWHWIVAWGQRLPWLSYPPS